MKVISSLVLASSLFALAVPLQAVIERTVEKSFTVNGAGTLRLETSGGSVTVTPVGPEGQVKITARQRIRADSDAEADKLLQDLDLKFDQSGNDVSASAKYSRQPLGFRFGAWPPVSVEFVATVPASFASQLRTSGGGITVGDLLGAVDARTSGGSIRLGKLGGRVEARTSGGSITLDECRDEANLHTSGGTITVGRVAGPADLSTSGGSIRIESVEQRLKAHTSGGSIRAGISGPLKGDCSLSTSGGSVRVAVDKAASFHLDASTSGGGVSAEGITITLNGGKQSRNKLVGDVNGGGPELNLRTSGGSITVSAK